jgi:enoyl-[acyl-carrier protein] reductase III
VSSELKGEWFLVLGASSGFGAAASRKLAKSGMNVFGVHLDRKAAMPAVEELLSDIKAEGVQAKFYNINAADAAKRTEVLDDMVATMGGEGKIRVLLHSLAFGALKPFIQENGDTLNRNQMDMTCDVMAHSLVYWVQDVYARGLFGDNSRVFAMTSSGSTRVMPSYGAVSAAKAALESHIRQLAMELGPKGITSNAIRAGVTDTPALRKIPGNEIIINTALAHNPSNRLTTPEDVADALALLCQPGAYWINGNVLGVDGGEDVTG